MTGFAQLFEGMEKAEGYGTGKYFEEGKYLVRVKSLKVVKSKNPATLGFPFFIAETEVLKSNNPEVTPGVSRTYNVKIQGNQYAFADLKNFIFALALDIDPKSPPPLGDPAHALATKIVSGAVDPEYLAKLRTTDSGVAEIVDALPGLCVNLEAFKKATRAKPGQTQGGFFTIHNWSPATEAETAAA